MKDVQLSDGSWFVNGKTLSSFTFDEERTVEKDSLMPSLLEEKLKSRGAKIAKAGNFEKSASIYQRVVSGQNLASARGVGETMRELLEARKTKAA